VDPVPLANAAGADKSVTTSLFVCIIRAMVLFTKAGLVLFTFMWVRWSLPRFPLRSTDAGCVARDSFRFRSRLGRGHDRTDLLHRRSND
jgi:hypothetical protein